MPRKRASDTIEIEGPDPLVKQLRPGLRRALAGRHAHYTVRIESNRVGEVLVDITGAHGRAPLAFDRDEAEPGFVAAVVRETVARFGL